MAQFENYASTSNQAVTQTIHGNQIFNEFTLTHKRFRPGHYQTDPEKSLDDEIISSLAFPQMLDRRSQIESAHPETCQWLFDLDQYKHWERESRGLLWIKGKPGSGKSTLMAHLYRSLWLKRQAKYDVSLEFFFSARGAALQHTPIGMMRSLLSQIFHQCDGTRDILRRCYREKRQYFGNSGDIGFNWQLPELQSLFLDTVTTCARQRRIILFIDALDEAGDEAARAVAKYIHKLNDHIVRSAGTAKICISCRHYPIISDAKAVEIHMEHHNRHDILRYVTDDVEAREGIDVTDIVQTLTNRARGVFQWVRLVVPMINRWLHEGDSTERVLANLSTVPRDLEAVYHHIVSNVIDTRYRQKTLRLFQWVCFARRPILVAELRYALAAEGIDSTIRSVRCHEHHDFEQSGEAMWRRITSWSGGLVEVVKSKSRWSGKPFPDWTGPVDAQTVQVIHQSVTDFMIQHGLSLLMAYNDNELSAATMSNSSLGSREIAHKSNEMMYLSCLRYMSTEHTDERALISDVYIPYGECYMEQIEVQHQFPFLEYAARFALYHARRSGNQRSIDLESEARLLHKSCPLWTFACKSTVDINFNSTEDFSFIVWESPEIQYVRDGIAVLHLAAAGHLKDLTDHIIRGGGNVEAADMAGWSAIHVAVAQGYSEVVESLHKAGADIHRETKKGDTPLLLAARRGHLNVFSNLLEHGARMNGENQSSEGVLYTAALNGHVVVCRMCLSAGADVHAQGGRYGNALQAAAAAYMRDNGDVVHLLLEAGADVNAQGGWYGNALQAASYYGYEGVVHRLLEAGADVNAQGGWYGNALQAAAAELYGGESLIRLLLKAGADVNAQGGHFGNALQAVMEGSKWDHVDGESVVRLLLNAGADANAQGGYYGNALQAAVVGQKWADREGGIRLLLEAGADVNAQGGAHFNALHAAVSDAAYDGVGRIVRLLLEAGADINSSGYDYDRVMRAAGHLGDTTAVETLDVVGATPVSGNDANGYSEGDLLSDSRKAHEDGNEADLETIPVDVDMDDEHVSEGPETMAHDHEAGIEWDIEPEAGGYWLLQMLGRWFPRS